MNLERERKFLVVPHLLPQDYYDRSRTLVETGYFSKSPDTRVSLRTKNYSSPGQTSSSSAKICIKGPWDCDARMEFEYPIPISDAIQILRLAPYYLEKTRVEYHGWEIDSFHSILLSKSQPLILAEYEEDGDKPGIVDLPNWVLCEVTGNPRFDNSSLAFEFGSRHTVDIRSIL